MYLDDITVSPTYRQRGIGRGLIGELKRLIADTDSAEIWVGTSVDNEAAQALFASTGARNISVRYIEFLYRQDSFA